MKMTKTIVLLMVAALLSACGGQMRPNDEFVFESGTLAERSSIAWFDGDYDEALKLAGKSKEIGARFVDAEAAYWRGDLEYAYKRHSQLLKAAPDHVLARYSAARLYVMRDSIMDYESRTGELLDGIDYAKLEPATRLYVGFMEQHVEFQEWYNSDSIEPFDGGAIGFPHRWALTPRMSPFRLRDLDTPFAPETAARLTDTYLTPAIAVDTELNYEDTVPWEPTSLALSPPLGSDGIYYMETFMTTQSDMEFWVQAQFVGAARVFIDGEEVFRRDEGSYETGKRIRKIELSKGTHRILVKLAYQNGYRDWFELNFIPTQKQRAKSLPIKFQPTCLKDRVVLDCFEGNAAGEISLETDVFMPAQLEPVLVKGEKVDDASDIALYLTMLSGFFGDDAGAFDDAWKKLKERRPKFAPGFALESSQIQTRWEVPSRLRDPISLQALREAVERDPDSVLLQHRLGSKLKDKDKDAEIRQTLERAKKLAFKDGRLRMVAPLNTWASYLAGQGWDEAAESAWRDALAASESNCVAARRIQILEHAREIYRKPADITPMHAKCKELSEAYFATRSELLPERLKLYEQYAKRYPYRSSSQLSYANQLVRHGRAEDAKLLVNESLKRMPTSMQLWNWKIDRAFADEGRDAALKLLDELERKNGTRAFTVWKRTAMEEKVPLADLMPDGKAAAMKAVADGANKSLSNDDAYFVVDFAARHYYPDGSYITLTHTVVRVMTKNAIDRYAESSIPSDARVLLARTVKADGTIQEPEQVSGKSTLSMPGLAEGDFVELAYLQYGGASIPGTEVSGVRFFFRMQDISTLHSEYVILGLKGNFLLENDPPKMETIEHNGVSGVRFLAKDNPRPRAEPQSVGVEEYLPWIQMYRNGYSLEEFEVSRRYRMEQIQDSLKVSPEYAKQLDTWTKPTETEPAQSPELVKRMFYEISQWIPDPSAGEFGTEVSHAALLKEGSAHLLLKSALDHANIPAEIYLARSVYSPKEVSPVREFQRYVTPLIRIEIPDTDEVHWVSPDGPDAMYGAVANSVQGQPAVCVTCMEPKKDTVHSSPCPTTDPQSSAACKLPGALRTNTQYVDVNSELDTAGNLTGRITITFDGANAVSFRAGLRARTDETSRAKLASAVAAGIVPGSDVVKYKVVGEKSPGDTLQLTVDFTRPSFARPGPDGKALVVETRLFHEAVAQVYATLPNRTIPILVSYPRHAASSFKIKFPRAPKLGSKPDTKTYEGTYGRYVRTTMVEGQTVSINTEFDMPVQRVPVEEYAAFQTWAQQIEQASPFFAIF